MDTKKDKNENITGEVGIIITLGGQKYKGKVLSWTEFNTETRRAQKSGNLMEYIGADRDYKGKMYCAFQETSVDSLKKGKPDKLCLYFVENDVVFKFQENKKSLDRKDYNGEQSEEEKYEEVLEEKELEKKVTKKTTKKKTVSSKTTTKSKKEKK